MANLNLVQPCPEPADILIESYLALYMHFAALFPKQWKNSRLLNCGRWVGALGLLCLAAVARMSTLEEKLSAKRLDCQPDRSMNDPVATRE